MQFVINTNEELDEKTGSYLLSLLSDTLIANGYTIEYMEMDELSTSHPMGDFSITEETYFQSKITRKLPPKKKMGGGCANGACPIGD